jgi:P27 family predicted phage terminase small subunit
MPTPRKSIPDHELQGTRVRYVLPDSGVLAGRPALPKGLSPAAKKTFRRLVKMLTQRRTITAGDQEIIGLYCITFDRHQRALEKLAVEGEIRIYEHVAKGEIVSVEKENLWYPIARDAAKFMKSCLSDLGLTPLQRAKVKQTEVKKSEEDEFPAAKEDTVLPTEEIDLSSIDEGAPFGEPTTTEIPMTEESRALLAEIDAEEKAEAMKCETKP